MSGLPCQVEINPQIGADRVVGRPHSRRLRRERHGHVLPDVRGGDCEGCSRADSLRRVENRGLIGARHWQAHPHAGRDRHRARSAPSRAGKPRSFDCVTERHVIGANGRLRCRDRQPRGKGEPGKIRHGNLLRRQHRGSGLHNLPAIGEIQDLRAGRHRNGRGAVDLAGFHRAIVLHSVERQRVERRGIDVAARLRLLRRTKAVWHFQRDQVFSDTDNRDLRHRREGDFRSGAGLPDRYARTVGIGEDDGSRKCAR